MELKLQSPSDFIALINKHFDYDKIEGELIWKLPTSTRTRVGDLAGTLNPDGYIQFQFMGKLYKVHRIVWLLETGNWPEHMIDHIDRDRSNNRFGNLRDATAEQNSNNTSVHADCAVGIKGVCYDPKYAAKPWRVQISRRGVVVHRSYHKTEALAETAARAFYESIGAPY